MEKEIFNRKFRFECKFWIFLGWKICVSCRRVRSVRQLKKSWIFLEFALKLCDIGFWLVNFSVLKIPKYFFDLKRYVIQRPRLPDEAQVFRKFQKVPQKIFHSALSSTISFEAYFILIYDHIFQCSEHTYLNKKRFFMKILYVPIWN